MDEPEDHAGALAAVLSGHEIVDLSVTTGERWPCWWPTQMPFQQKVWNWFAEAGHPSPVHAYMGPVHIRWMTIDDHCEIGRAHV